MAAFAGLVFLVEEDVGVAAGTAGVNLDEGHEIRIFDRYFAIVVVAVGNVDDVDFELQRRHRRVLG